MKQIHKGDRVRWMIFGEIQGRAGIRASQRTGVVEEICPDGGVLVREHCATGRPQIKIAARRLTKEA